MSDQAPPWINDSEKATLLAFLDYLRNAVVAKLEGLTDEQTRQPGVPSETSLLGLVKHLTMVEAAWFSYGFAGTGEPVPDGRLSSEDDLESVIDQYRSACDRSNELVAACTDLGQRCARAVTAPEVMSLRWVLTHMIEETARHAGHADILREQIDGRVGR